MLGHVLFEIKTICNIKQKTFVLLLIKSRYFFGHLVGSLAHYLKLRGMTSPKLCSFILLLCIFLLGCNGGINTFRPKQRALLNKPTAALLMFNTIRKFCSCSFHQYYVGPSLGILVFSLRWGCI